MDWQPGEGQLLTHCKQNPISWCHGTQEKHPEVDTDIQHGPCNNHFTPWQDFINVTNIKIDSKCKRDPGLKIHCESGTIFGIISKACQGINISSRTLLTSSKWFSFSWHNNIRLKELQHTTLCSLDILSYQINGGKWQPVKNHYHM